MKTERQDFIEQLNALEKMCKEEASKKPINKDLFQSGKQMAYSHIYFTLQSIVKKANWINEGKILQKHAIAIISFCLGALIILYFFKS